MRTLSANASSNVYLLENSPRLLVRVCDAYDTLITSFDTSIKSSGVISRSIKPFGGIETVSELTLANLELGEDVRFCTETTLNTYDEGSRRGAGRIIKQGTDYTTARNAPSGSWATPSITVGQQFNGAAMVYGVYVGFMQVYVPSGLLTADEATFFLKGLQNYSTTDFDIYLLQGTWSALSDEGAMFNDYVGWASSGAYTVTALNETYNTGEYVYYNMTKVDNEAYNLIRLNRSGLDYLETCAGGVARFAFISKRHADNTTPTGNEYVNFDAPTATMKLRYNTNTLNNKRVYVYRYYDPFSGDYTTMQEVYRGVVDHYTLDNRVLTLTIKKSDPKTNIVIPKTVLTQEDYPLIPEENIGKAVPIVYGDFMAEEYHKEGVAYVKNEATGDQYAWRDYVKAYMYDSYSTKNAIIAGHAIKTLDNVAVNYMSSDKAFALIAGTVATVTDESNKKVKLSSLTSSSKFPGNLAPDQMMIPIICYIPAWEENGHTEPIDSDPTNYYLMAPGEEVATFKFSSFDQGKPHGDVYTDLVYVCFYVEKVSTDPYDGNMYCTVRSYDKDGGTAWEGSVTIDHDGWYYYEIPYTGGTERVPQSGNLAWLIYFVNGTSVDKVNLYNLCVAYACKTEVKIEFYISVQGAYDDVSGTVTGSASALIENPSHIVESIARSIIGLSSSEINTTAFDSSATTLTDWTMAFQLLEQLKVERIFNDIGEQCKSAVFRDELDRLSMKTWRGDDFKFPHSGTDIPANLDIFAEECDSTFSAGIETMTRNVILRNSLVLDRVKSSEMSNSFILRYKKNYATGNYDGVLFIDNGEGDTDDADTNLVAGDEAYMADSQTIAGLKAITAASYTDNNNTTNQLVFEADYIRSRETAVKFLQHLVESFAPRRRVVQFDTKENGMWVEFGDVINIRHRRLYDELGLVAPDRMKWYPYSIRHNLSRGTITIKAIEV